MIGGETNPRPRRGVGAIVQRVNPAHRRAMGDELFEGGGHGSVRVRGVKTLLRSSRRKEALTISDFGFRISDFSLSLSRDAGSAATRFVRAPVPKRIKVIP